MNVSLRQPVLLALALSCAPLANADYLWLERSAGQSAKSYFSELQPGEHLPVAQLQNSRVVLGDGKTAPMKAGIDSFEIASAPAGDLRVAAQRAEGGTLTIYQAREGRTETRAQNDLELVPTTPGGNTFALHWKGTVVPASQVNVYTSEQWTRSLKPAADGTVTLITPFPARYVLEVSAQVNGGASIEGKRYDSVIHVSTLSFEVRP
ncbi:hypothetical protein [Pseudomonas sp. PDM22]|uniref:hypothetical protein n=1 Tax=Pseudomonas sp. PDM22 TaxID=2769287 RepID=UPI00178102CF|nr:hypothetical protein [Pseudomonas sp. PDM22]MBD9513928.1 hypothetical protein [Pseudomonas sp. PDM22]